MRTIIIETTTLNYCFPCQTTRSVYRC